MTSKNSLPTCVLFPFRFKTVITKGIDLIRGCDCRGEVKKKCREKNTQKLKKILLNHQFNHVSGNFNVSVIPYSLSRWWTVLRYQFDSYNLFAFCWWFHSAQSEEVFEGKNGRDTRNNFRLWEEKLECVIKDTSSRNRK